MMVFFISFKHWSAVYNYFLDGIQIEYGIYNGKKAFLAFHNLQFSTTVAHESCTGWSKNILQHLCQSFLLLKMLLLFLGEFFKRLDPKHVNFYSPFVFDLPKMS